MYNGIGLQTPRGSGTNGYIQTNKFFIRPRPLKSQAKEFQEGQGAGGVTRKANKDILEHDRKRQTELKLVLLEETLVEQGYTSAEIAHQLDEARKAMESAPQDQQELESSSGASENTHQMAARKDRQIEVLRTALGLGDVKEGEAFDREIQEQRKQERIRAYEERQREKELKVQEDLRKVKEERKQKKLQEKEQQRLAKEEEKKKVEEIKAERRREEEREEGELHRQERRELERRQGKVGRAETEKESREDRRDLDKKNDKGKEYEVKDEHRRTELKEQRKDERKRSYAYSSEEEGQMSRKRERLERDEDRYARHREKREPERRDRKESRESERERRTVKESEERIDRKRVHSESSDEEGHVSKRREGNYRQHSGHDSHAKGSESIARNERYGADSKRGRP